ncbi:MAG: hypothetical protein AVDCRST_MAG91-727 [uncultured Sphingomonadaceae bacterium]|uniref:Uncharacterized protein n=1 Tax=uncultured Sphingomonadaceae bacterium TaxID=169976 RepID=A0A6J4SBC5_9SPHN|nr:MAG: hypothetical protein AVDCRST_MAG91-727 [uncultured Sphingomonadaceae bacterium]
MNVDDPAPAPPVQTSIRQKKKKRKSDGRLQFLEVLLKGRTLPLIMAVLALAYIGIKGAEYRASSYYADVLPRQGEAEVLYQRGKPESVRRLESGGSEWVYAAPAVRVRFGPDGRVISTSCSNSGPQALTGCPPALGVAIGDDELQLAARLGTPPRTSLVNGVKVAEYPGPGLKYHLQRFRVQSVEVMRRADIPEYLKQFAVFALPA